VALDPNSLDPNAPWIPPWLAQYQSTPMLGRSDEQQAPLALLGSREDQQAPLTGSREDQQAPLALTRARTAKGQAEPTLPPLKVGQDVVPTDEVKAAQVDTSDTALEKPDESAAQVTPPAAPPPGSIAPGFNPDAVSQGPAWLAAAQQQANAPKLGAVDYALSKELGEPTATGENAGLALHQIAMDPNASVSDRQIAWQQLTPQERTNIVNTMDPRQLATVATAAMSPEELGAITLRHKQAQIHQESAQQLGIAIANDEAAQRNFAAHQMAIEHANRETDAIAQEAAKIANTKIVTPHGAGFTVLSILGGALGGLAAHGAGQSGNPFIEGLNRGIERNIALQKDEIANRWKTLDVRKNLVAEQYQRSGDMYRAQEITRIAHYDSAIKQAQILAQDYDPQGTTAIGIAQQTQAVQAQRAAALQAVQQTMFKNKLDLMKAQSEALREQEVARHNKQAESLQGWGISSENLRAKNQNAIELLKLDEERAKREQEAELKNAAKLKEKQDEITERGMFVPTGIGPNGAVQHAPLMQQDGKTPWIAPKDASVDLGKIKAATIDGVKQIDDMRLLRQGFSTTSQFFNWATTTEAGRKLLQKEAKVILDLHEASGINRFSGEVVELSKKILTGGVDVDSAKSLLEELDNAREMMIDGADANLRGKGNYTGADLKTYFPDPVKAAKTVPLGEQLTQPWQTYEPPAPPQQVIAAPDTVFQTPLDRFTPPQK
jgi:hypothetical protein